jgi:hypothetical protein
LVCVAVIPFERVCADSYEDACSLSADVRDRPGPGID